MSDIVIFEDMPNDAAFIEWLKNNQNGFVLNINKGKTEPIYPMLHKASSGCGSFPTEKIGKNWTTKGSDYFKVCSNSRERLRKWSWNEYDRENRCKTCFKKELDEEKTAWLTEEQNSYTNSIPHLGKNIAELENRLASETSPEKQTELKKLNKSPQRAKSIPARRIQTISELSTDRSRYRVFTHCQSYQTLECMQ